MSHSEAVIASEHPVTAESIAAARAAQLAERAAVEWATGWVFHGDRLLPTDGVRLGLTLRNAILGAVYGQGAWDRDGHARRAAAVRVDGHHA